VLRLHVQAETARTKKVCRREDAQAFDLMVAKGGIEPPTQGKDFQAAQINGVLLLIKLLQHTPRFESSGTKAGTSPTEPRRVTA
jgi:hypothetical protein